MPNTSLLRYIYDKKNVCFFYIKYFLFTHAQCLAYNIDCFGYIHMYVDAALAYGSYVNGTALLNQGMGVCTS